MNYHIFHTSHCASTLLAALLSESLPVLTEPDWSHKIHEHNNIDEVYRQLKDGELIKYSSVYCYLAPHIQDKKVFLYRKLGAHLEKMSTRIEYLIDNLEHANKIMGHNRHPRITYFNQIDYIMNHAVLWVERYFWMKECNRTAWVETNYFLQYKQETCETICNFFDIPYKHIPVNFHVKNFGLNHSNQPLKVERTESTYDDKPDIIEEYSYPVMVALDKIHRMFPDIPENVMI
jgi:hypothetical protein